MRKTILNYGFLSGVVLAGLMVSQVPYMDRMGNWGWTIGYACMLLGLLFVYFGVRSYRDNVAAGKITFGKAFLVGSAIALIGMCCYVATWEVIFYKFTPNFMDNYAAHQIERARAAGASEAELARKSKELAAAVEAYKNPIVNIGYTFLEPLPVALLMTLVTAALVKRKEPVPITAGN